MNSAVWATSIRVGGDPRVGSGSLDLDRDLDQEGLPPRVGAAQGEVEAVARGERLAVEAVAGLLWRAVHLLRVAAAARGDHVLPDVQTPARTRDDVVEVLGAPAAVLAGPAIASEDGPAREGRVGAEGDVDEAPQPHDRG